MTRKTFSLTLICISAFNANAEYTYNNGQYEYRPEYYVVPPPGYTSPTPRHTYAYSATTYNPDGTGGTTATAVQQSSGPGFMDGWQPYFRADVGPSLFEDTHLTQFGVAANDTVRFKPGANFDAAAGYAFSPYLAADLELGFIGAEVDHINFFTFDHADYYNLPILVNAIGSWPLKDGRIIPYLGGGLGGSIAIFDTKNLTTPANPTISGTETTVVFAGQIFTGVRFQLNSKIWLGAGYKYFISGDPTWDYPGGFKFGMKAPGTHSLLFTFLWKF